MKGLRIRDLWVFLTALSLLPILTSTFPVSAPTDPFAVLDPQNWVDPAAMTWADYVPIPSTDWSNPSKRGRLRNFNIALLVLDYPDVTFTITKPPNSTIFGNPQPIASNLTRADVSEFYRDLLNTPSSINRGHTLHEYWMGDSGGRFGVDLTAFGPYKMPAQSFQYGISQDMNPGECVTGFRCNLNIRTDAINAWRADIGNASADAYELVFILSAGQDESSTWQEFGEMKFQTKEAVPDAFGPPKQPGINNDTNYARTRYVDWTSWAAAATIWPNAGGGSSTQAESSGMGVYAHELSHLLDIGDNYNNPYGVPLRRSYTGPWSMMSRGSFNGPGGPHTRWQIPAVQGGSLGSLHTVRDKLQLGLASNESVLRVSREALADSGVVVARLTARAVDPGPEGLLGIRVLMDTDRSPRCNISSDVFCDGGGFNSYMLEVVDRMGADSFTPDSGVMISKSKDAGRAPAPFQWTIDANPQDIELIDFYRPDGTVAMITLGDYRQLADALFHAGTRSGSEFEYVDEANRLHLYVIEKHRDEMGMLSYTVAVRSLDGSGSSKHGVELSQGKVAPGYNTTLRERSTACVFQLTNTGSYVAGGQHPQDLSRYLKSDVYRLSAQTSEEGWRVELPNDLVAVEFGGFAVAIVAVAATTNATQAATVELTVISESAESVIATAQCQIST
ncbi:M6 family metalloprotease [Patellaria atrata CBS 101060]|uniref:M6 family metalloprotease n=1 Tax=Patellaria atrata CBS 101060 TaxID=1346257 RepID=A0A9P4S377_9PEZI|nr:M6 family metalloprotease [Patellaria atrata CBS 101060]